MVATSTTESGGHERRTPGTAGRRARSRRRSAGSTRSRNPAVRRPAGRSTEPRRAARRARPPPRRRSRAYSRSEVGLLPPERGVGEDRPQRGRQKPLPARADRHAARPRRAVPGEPRLGARRRRRARSGRRRRRHDERSDREADGGDRPATVIASPDRGRGREREEQEEQRLVGTPIDERASSALMPSTCPRARPAGAGSQPSQRGRYQLPRPAASSSPAGAHRG